MVNRLVVSDVIAKAPAWLRLEDQINWYDKRSVRAQSLYKWLKSIQLVVALSLPLASKLPDEFLSWYSGGAGFVIAALEAIQQMNQYSTLWITYRATAERLKHEKHLFLGAAGPYKGLAEDEALVTLAERVEEHVSTEHANWFDETKKATAKGSQR